MHVNDLLKIAVDNTASDLHLKVGSYPMMRVRGALLPATEEKRLDHEDVVAMSAAVMSTSQRQKFKETQEVDLAYSVPGLGRFRVNIFQQRGTVGLVLRVIPMQIRTIDELGLPQTLKKIADEERGLVLVTGTTGSGKSTTLAALIDHINKTRSAHVMTVEDPIEFLHRDAKSIVNQREVAVDTRSFAQALRSALRQDPDVILVGEMRDFETIETGLLAAETGHLVLSTLHTLDATETINRIITVFPPHQQKQVRLQLASVLRAVVSQRLMPKLDGKGPRPRRRGHDQHRLHPRLHRRQGEDAHDPRRNRRGHVAVRDADLRSVDLRLVPAESDLLRRSAPLGEQRRRVQAEGAGHFDHLRDEPGSDGENRDRRPRNHEIWQLAPPISTA
jgi:twitching motility protein PilT